MTSKVKKNDKTNSYSNSVDENFEQKFTSHNSSKADIKMEAMRVSMDQVKEESAEISLLLANSAQQSKAKALRPMVIEEINSAE